MTEPLSFLGQSGPYSSLRRSAVDPITGNATLGPLGSGDPNDIVWRGGLLPVGRTRDGRTVPAGSQLGKGLVDLVSSIPDIIPEGIKTIDTAGRMMRGEIPMHDEDGRPSLQAIGTALGAAGLAATGSLPFSAPKGALRSFGGPAAKHDPLAALEAELANYVPTPLPKAAANPADFTAGAKMDWLDKPRVPNRVDPNAKSWDLYHGSEPGQDFARFDPMAGSIPSERGAVFFAPDPGTAVGYAGLPREGAEAGSRVFRTTIDPGRTDVFDLAHLAETDPAFNARARQLTLQDGGDAYGPIFDRYAESFRAGRAQHRDLSEQAKAMGYEPSAPDGLSFGYGHVGAAVQTARERGLDTAIIRGLAEHGGDDQVIALTPNRVRSFYAPDQLLYGLGGLGLGAAAYGAPDPAQAAPLAALGQAYYGPPAR